MTKYSAPYMDGGLAQREGVEDKDVPYSPLTQMFSYAEWISGWHTRVYEARHRGPLLLDQLWPMS